MVEMFQYKPLSTSALFAATTSLLISACQSLERKPTVHDYVAPLDPPGTHIFLSKEQPALHIGDDEGSIRDVKNYRKIHPDTRFVGFGYTWPFTLEGLPKGGTVALNVLSMALPYGETEYDCPTVLLINGEQVADLRKASEERASEADMIVVNVPAERFAVGKNTLTIEEQVCRGSKSSGGHYLNDSIVTGVVMRLQ